MLSSWYYLTLKTPGDKASSWAEQQSGSTATPPVRLLHRTAQDGTHRDKLSPGSHKRHRETSVTVPIHGVSSQPCGTDTVKELSALLSLIPPFPHADAEYEDSEVVKYWRSHGHSAQPGENKSPLSEHLPTCRRQSHKASSLLNSSRSRGRMPRGSWSYSWTAMKGWFCLGCI